MPPLLNIVYFCYVHTVSVLYCADLALNVPLVPLIFLKSSLVFPILFFPLFLCIYHLGKLSYLSFLFFGTLHSDGYIFPFLLCLLSRSLLHFLGPYAQNKLFPPSKSHWWVCDLILNTIVHLLLSCLSFSFVLGVGYLILVGSKNLQSMVVQH